ncbi:MAG: CDP-glucose 4,6-dehydratase [Flavobacteriales bacterium]|nr:CDP-glucose 4,6-dehydratase [Flavobacteriales bacterium]
MSYSDFYRGKKVLVTGHTGFKGTWMCIWLHDMGAEVIGYSNDTLYDNSLFEISNLSKKITDIRGDIRDLDALEKVFIEHQPEIILHLAAQSLVRLSYDIPIDTFSTNVMGTANVLECIRKHPVKSSVIITSDKCYLNIEKQEGYKEDDPFSTQDPYSASKGCAEMVAESYRYSFQLKLATTRAGNVVGGGDWAKDRLVPDAINALESNEDIVIRNPISTRPWQFVLEPIRGYLELAKRQYEGEDLNGGWNFGPERSSMVTVKEVIDLIIEKWGSGNLRIEGDTSNLSEAGLLFLDIDKADKQIDWRPKLNIDATVDYICEWYKNYKTEDAYQLCLKQIHKYDAL